MYRSVLVTMDIVSCDFVAHAVVCLLQGPTVPGPQEAVVITDSGALDDGETLSSQRARRAVAVHSDEPAVAMVHVNGQDAGEGGIGDVSVEELDATTLEARALLLAQRFLRGGFVGSAGMGLR